MSGRHPKPNTKFSKGKSIICVLVLFVVGLLGFVLTPSTSSSSPSTITRNFILLGSEPAISSSSQNEISASAIIKSKNQKLPPQINFTYFVDRLVNSDHLTNGKYFYKESELFSGEDFELIERQKYQMGFNFSKLINGSKKMDKRAFVRSLINNTKLRKNEEETDAPGTKSKKSKLSISKSVVLVRNKKNVHLASHQLSNLLKCSSQVSDGFYWNSDDARCVQLKNWNNDNRNVLENFEVSKGELSCPSLVNKWHRVKDMIFAPSDPRSVENQLKLKLSSSSRSFVLPNTILQRYANFIAFSTGILHKVSFLLQNKLWIPLPDFVQPAETQDYSYSFKSFHDPKINNIFTLENFCVDPSSEIPLRGFFSSSSSSSSGIQKSNNIYQGKDDTRNLFHGDFSFRRFLSNVGSRNEPPVFFDKRPVVFVPLTKISMRNLGHVSLKFLSLIGIIMKQIGGSVKGAKADALVVFVYDKSEGLENEQNGEVRDTSVLHELKTAWATYFQMLDLPWALIVIQNSKSITYSNHIDNNASRSENLVELCFQKGYAYQSCFTNCQDDNAEPYSFNIFDRNSPSRKILMDLRSELFFNNCGMIASSSSSSAASKNAHSSPKIFFDLRTESRGIARIATMIHQIEKEISLLGPSVVRGIAFNENGKTSRYRYLVDDLQNSDIFFGVHGAAFSQVWAMRPPPNNASGITLSPEVAAKTPSPIIIELSEKYFEQHCQKSRKDGVEKNGGDYSMDGNNNDRVSCWFGYLSEYMDADHWVLRVPIKKQETRWDGKNIFTLSIKSILNVLREGICRWHLKKYFTATAKSKIELPSIISDEMVESFRQSPDVSAEVKNYCVSPGGSVPVLWKRKHFSGLIPPAPSPRDFILKTSLSSSSSNSIFGGNVAIENVLTRDLSARQKNQNNKVRASSSSVESTSAALLPDSALTQFASRLVEVRGLFEKVVDSMKSREKGEKSAHDHVSYYFKLVAARPSLWQPFVDFWVNNVEEKNSQQIRVFDKKAIGNNNNNVEDEIKVLCLREVLSAENELSADDDECLYLW